MPREPNPMTRAERWALALLLIIGASVGFATWVDAQGPSYVRQQNPVFRQSAQLAPAEIVDAGDAAVNTASPVLYEYSGRCAWNKGTQCIMCYRDGGTPQTSGWEDICPGGAGGSGGGNEQWTFNDAGAYLHPANRPDAGTTGDNVRVSIGTTSAPVSGWWLQVGNPTVAARGRLLMQSHNTAGADPSIIRFLRGSEHFDISLQSIGGLGGFLQTNTRRRIVLGVNGGVHWELWPNADTSFGAWRPLADNVYDLAAPGRAARYVYVATAVLSTATGTGLNLGSGSTPAWRIPNGTTHFYPISSGSSDIGATGNRVRDFWLADEFYANGSAGTSNQVLHGGSPATWSAITASDISGGIPFTDITTGTNTTASMTCGTGCSIAYSGSGTVSATDLLGTTWPASFTTGDILYASGANTLTNLAAGTATYVLTSNGPGVAPSWQVVPSGGAPAFSTITSGTNTIASMVVGSGASLSYTGTGTIDASSLIGTTWPASFATGDLLYASGANTLTNLAAGTSGQVLTANGAGVAPSWQTATVTFDNIGTGVNTTATMTVGAGAVLKWALGENPQIVEGVNGCMGAVALTAGAATVSTTCATASGRIFLTGQSDGGVPGFLRVSSRVAGTSFDITSSSVLDTSTVAWLIIEPG